MSQILQVEDLIQEFDLTQDLLDRIKFKHGHFSVEQQVVHAVNHVSFDILRKARYSVWLVSQAAASLPQPGLSSVFRSPRAAASCLMARTLRI